MAVVVGKIFVVLIVVRSNSSVGAELGEIVLSVVVALDCGRCTGVVLLVNDSLPDVFVLFMRGFSDCDEAQNIDIKMMAVKMSECLCSNIFSNILTNCQGRNSRISCLVQRFTRCQYMTLQIGAKTVLCSAQAKTDINARR